MTLLNDTSMLIAGRYQSFFQLGNKFIGPRGFAALADSFTAYVDLTNGNALEADSHGGEFFDASMSHFIFLHFELAFVMTVDVQKNIYSAGHTSENNAYFANVKTNAVSGFVIKQSSNFAKLWSTTIIGGIQTICDWLVLDDNQQTVLVSGFTTTATELLFYDGQGNANRTQTCKLTNTYAFFIARYESNTGKLLEVLCYPVSGEIDGTNLAYGNHSKYVKMMI